MTNHFTIKLVTTTEYHLWNDVLHARKLAKETTDDWNKGFYVRTAVIFAWIALEQSCKDALDDKDIGFSFYRDMNKAISEKQLVPIDWDNGVWKDASELKSWKNQYTHANSNQSDLWPEVDKADDALSFASEAIKDIYKRAGKSEPNWVNDDN